jgi:hypothetical protein
VGAVYYAGFEKKESYEWLYYIRVRHNVSNPTHLTFQGYTHDYGKLEGEITTEHYLNGACDCIYELCDFFRTGEQVVIFNADGPQIAGSFGDNYDCGSRCNSYDCGNPFEGEGEGDPSLQMLSADWDGVAGVISLTELLRVIQFYNANGFACADVEDDTEDGFMPGPGDARDCPPHTSDYLDSDWSISLSELLRLIQIFNAGGYEYCPEAGTDDGFCPVAR